MNIVVLGAGAIGSLFGGLLSKNNNVILIGRKPHVNEINSKGLKITGKTNKIIYVSSEYDIKKVSISIDLLLITVKSYDTEQALKSAKSIITKDTIICSFQNGLGNIEKIKNYVNQKNIIAGVTTHGVVFIKPGQIEHTGIGWTVFGELDGTISKRIKEIVRSFNDVGIKTEYSENIKRELWSKAIINSSINTLTSYFECKNGYLLQNPILENIVEKICRESTSVAQAYGIDISYDDMLKKTKKVIQDTSNNYSSMFQSVQKGDKTEIESINGYISSIGDNHDVSVFLNKILENLLKFKH